LKISAKALTIPERSAGITAATTGEDDAPIMNPAMSPPRAIPTKRTRGMAAILFYRMEKRKVQKGMVLHLGASAVR
jgi:hypothetical protein